MSDSSLRSRRASVLAGMISVLLSVGCRGNGVRYWRGDQVGRPVVAISLGVDAVQVLGNADTSTVQQELRQEVALCSWGGIITSEMIASWKHNLNNTKTNNDSWVLSDCRDFRSCSSSVVYYGNTTDAPSAWIVDQKKVPLLWTSCWTACSFILTNIWLQIPWEALSVWKYM